MNTETRLDNYVIFHGPPFVGKSSYFRDVLSKTYERVCPNEIFQTGVALSMRQIINNCIIRPLLKGRRVAVDDSMQTAALRKSYISTVMEKIPEISCTCVVFRPEFGKEQLMWKREFSLAEAVLNQEWHFVEKVLSTDIDRWYEECDAVSEDEDFRKIVLTIPLQINSSQQFDVPCLLIEYKGLIDPKLPGLLETWYSRNPRGRIIAVFETQQTSKNDDVKKSVIEFLRCMQINTELVVYALHCHGDNLNNVTSFITSVMAFLMRLHCLDIFSTNSVYLYESMKHRRMVELIGMRHLRLARALINPDLLRHGATQFPKPKLLQSLKVRQPEKNLAEGDGEEMPILPSVPLLADALESSNCVGKVSIGSQRTIYVAAKNAELLNKYQARFSSASVDECAEVDGLSSVAKREERLRKKKLPRSDYVALPDWMLSKRHKSQEDDARPKDGALPSTMYIMSEKELMKTAVMILKELEDTDSGDETLMKTPANVGKSALNSSASPEKSKTAGKQDDEDTSILNEVFHDFYKAADQCPESVDFKSPLASQLYEKRKNRDVAVLDQRPAGVSKESNGVSSNSIITDNGHTLNGILSQTRCKTKDRLTKSNELSECRTSSETKKLETSNSDLSDFIDHLIM